MSQFHLSEWDRLLGETLDAHPDMEVFMSADHGMNFKRRCYDLNKILAAARRGDLLRHVRGARSLREAPPHLRRNRVRVAASGGRSFERVGPTPAGASRASRRCTTATPPPRSFLLHPDRIGDLLVTGDIDTVFGPLEAAEEPSRTLPRASARTGPAHELRVPLVVYGVPVGLTRPGRAHAQRPSHAVTEPGRLTSGRRPPRRAVGAGAARGARGRGRCRRARRDPAASFRKRHRLRTERPRVTGRPGPGGPRGLGNGPIAWPLGYHVLLKG